MSVLITGAAGFLGTEVTRLILKQTADPIIVLIRSHGPEGGGSDDGQKLEHTRQRLERAERRLERVWRNRPEMVREIGGRIQVVSGDLCQPKFGLSDTSYEELTGRISHIIHLAADIRLNEPLDLLRKINTEGVRNIVELAYAVQRRCGLTRLAYVSTAYVAGRRKGIVPEDELTDRFGFSNNYELTKFEGESLIRTAGKELPVTVFRPGMVIGDSLNGEVKTFNTLYFPLRLYLTGKLKFLPVNPDMKINMVPCDLVSGAIAKLTFDPQAEGMTFHLTLPSEALPTVREMIEYTREWAFENLHIKLPKPVFLSLPLSCFRWLGGFLLGKSPVRSLLTLTSYFKEHRSYRRDNLDRLLGMNQEHWRGFFPQILTYACSRGFMHRSERTVHEQIMFRLSRKSRRIRYHDVINGRIITRNAGDVEMEIRDTVSALRQMGVQPGDRVAVVGFNSTRYFVIDTAIGLAGAVSVPLYYSSPICDLTDILNDCNARALFVGVPEILAKLSACELGIPVVSFCREISVSPGNAEPSKPRNEIKAPVRFGDIATLRYTSGTTGRPKGAAFDHSNLLSMAETLASLPPWKARTQKVVYLSFLPMNHVVEGILVSYSVYYTPAPVDIYYLEDFHELQKALPKIRPTVFFSVPRFYEKVWDSAAQSLIGRQYIKCRQGSAKRLLGRLLGMAVKKKAGIDRCAQLIVGSAPVSEELLRNFRSIGIEVHNAYGLTEAPLITMNRYGANRIDSVGEPLPETQLRIAEDGEVLVRGPQVMRGYFTGNASQMMMNPDASPDSGWLHTGDYGSLTDDGYLVLSGRKKETLINSYGKNINPVKIELMLRDATGIDQIMLYGDKRPYCTAFFFGCPAEDYALSAVINDGIRKVNEGLSHPEQIRRWALLPESLTIKGGELTANLKMKRMVIAEKYKAAIEALYEN